MLTKRLLLLLCPVGAAIVIASAIAAEPPVPQQDEASKQLESLLKERRDTLRQLVTFLDGRLLVGKASKESVIRASNQLLDAELDLARTKAERIAIHEKLVDNLRGLEKIIESGAHYGTRQLDDVFSAKADRLKAEVQLLREKIDDKRT